MKNSVVHIIPTGLEYDRVISGLKEYPGNKVYFIKGSDENEVELRSREIIEDVKHKIKDLYEIEEEFVNVHDFYDILKKVSKILQLENKNGSSILVNASCGTKIVVIALSIAAFFYNAQLYYIIPKFYEIDGKKMRTSTTIPENFLVKNNNFKTFSSGVHKIISIPPLLIQKPNNEELNILKILVEPANSLKEIAKKANFGEDKKDIAKASYYIRKLEEENLIAVERSKRNMKMQITEKGQIIISVLDP
ncbi:MAG: HFX_2341 family transcriptional regulator domain-containing protein [Candidatus Helarchaeota archaeon]